jgi:hypothetical protein
MLWREAIMSDDDKIAGIGSGEPKKTRRAFVKTAAQVAVTAPAVTILLAAGTKPAAAGTAYVVLSADGTPVREEHSGSFNGNADDDF